MPFIKVCGIQSPAEAALCLAAGADTLGLLLGLTHVAEDGVTLSRAREIVAAVPLATRTVMVTHLLDPREIAGIAGRAGVSCVQLQNALSVEGLVQLRMLLPNLELIKAIHVEGADTLKTATEYADHADMVLLDSRTEDRLGGTGLTHDWSVSAAVVRALSVPVILAGGLNPENVDAAIAKVGPAGIDANSGLEGPDGTKDFAKVKAFALAGRHCSFAGA